MLRYVPFAEGEFYHIYSRGVEKRKIYLDDLDYFRFVLLLYLCNTTENIHLSKIFRDLKRRKNKSGQGDALTRQELLKLFEMPLKNRLVSVCIWCLMPNHFHLILKETREGGITQFMQKLMTAYSMHFNKKYERSGPLFTTPFRSKHIKDDKYFQCLFGYVHLNPVKIIDSKWKEKGIKDIKKAKDFLRKYKYSSYLDFLGQDRPEKNILSLEDVPDYFSGVGGFKNFVGFWTENALLYADENEENKEDEEI